jgi:hypothetical protein
MSIRKVQIGAEGTAGTAVPATTILRGEAGDIADERVQIEAAEDVGYLSGTDRRYTAAELAVYEPPDTEATFEQIDYVYSAGIDDQVTGVADGDGAGKIRTYTLPTTAEHVVKTFTLEGRNSTEPVMSEYNFVTKFSLSGAPQEAIKLTGVTWNGRQVALQAYTGSLSLPAVEEMLFGKTSLYIDAHGGTIGSTQKTGTLLGFNIDVVTGWEPLFTGEGNLYFTRPKFYPKKMSVTGSITFEFDGSATAEEAFWKSHTARKLQLKTVGSAISDGDTGVYAAKTHIFNAAIKWTKFNVLDSTDGNDTVTADFVARYSTDATFFAQFITVNTLAALP